MAAAARREGRSAFDLARFYEDAFHRDLAALNVRPAQAYPRASECIELMLALIERLVALGHAYPCLLYTSDAADEEDSVDLGGRRIIKKKKKTTHIKKTN